MTLTVDCTTQKLPGEGFKHPRPPLIKMDEAVKAKIEKLFGFTYETFAPKAPARESIRSPGRSFVLADPGLEVRSCHPAPNWPVSQPFNDFFISSTG
jgi:hypothetical protein